MHSRGCDWGGRYSRQSRGSRRSGGCAWTPGILGRAQTCTDRNGMGDSRSTRAVQGEPGARSVPPSARNKGLALAMLLLYDGYGGEYVVPGRGGEDTRLTLRSRLSSSSRLLGREAPGTTGRESQSLIGSDRRGEQRRKRRSRLWTCARLPHRPSPSLTCTPSHALSLKTSKAAVSTSGLTPFLRGL